MYFLILFSLADMYNEDAWVVHTLAAPSQTLLLTLNLNEVIVLDSFLYATLCENDNEVVFGKYKTCMHGNVIWVRTLKHFASYENDLHTCNWLPSPLDNLQQA